MNRVSERKRRRREEEEMKRRRFLFSLMPINCLDYRGEPKIMGTKKSESQILMNEVGDTHFSHHRTLALRSETLILMQTFDVAGDAASAVGETKIESSR